MPRDLTPPKTHAGDTGQRPHDDLLPGLIDALREKDYPDRQAVDKIAGLVSGGKIVDKEAVSGEALRAYSKQNGKSFETAVNKKLESLNSPYRIKIDESLAAVQDMGSLRVDLINKDSRQLVDRCSASIDNSPKVPTPPIEYPRPISPQLQQSPSELPRLDIIQPPARRSPWG